MARDINSRAHVELSINGRKAASTLDELRGKAALLKNKITEATEAGKPPKEIAAMRKEFEQTAKQVQQCQTELGAVNDVLRRLDSASPKELNRTLRTLKNELNSIERGSKAWDDHTRKIKLVEAELKKTNATLASQQSRWSAVNGKLNEFSTEAMVAIGAVTGLIMAGKKAISTYADMEEELANTRKFTGMTREGVDELNESFKKMDTRIGRAELNKLAQEGGRLGKSTQDAVLQYVKGAGVINVALSDLGEGATQKIAKLGNIFKIEELYGTYEAMMKIGSVVNVLSQNCTASKPYLVEFASRLAGIGNMAKVSIQDIIGMGAVLDANAQKVESSATAVGQVLMRIYREPAKYAKVAGLDVEKFTNLLKKDANEALLQFLGALKKAGGLDTLSPMFADMGENGARAVAALSTLAQHIDEVRWQQENANKAFKEGTSALHEYEIFNNTVQAEMSKRREVLNEIAIDLGKKLMPVMRYFYSSSSIALRCLRMIVDTIIAARPALLSLISAIAAYYAAVAVAAVNTNRLTIAAKAHNIAVAAGNALHKAGAATVLLFSAAMNALTGHTTRARAAMHLFNTVVKMNPIGLVLSAVAALTTAYFTLIRKTDEYKKSMDKISESAGNFTEAAAKEKKELDELFGALEGAEKGSKEYLKAKDAILDRYGAYLSGLVNEKGEIISLTEAYERLSTAAMRSAQQRAIASAKEKASESYVSEIDNLTDELKKGLTQYGADDRSASEIVTRVTREMTLSGAIGDETMAMIRKFTSGKIISPWYAFKTNPLEVAGKMNSRSDDYKSRMQKFEKMSVRPLQNVQRADLESLKESLQAYSVTMSDRNFNSLQNIPESSVEMLSALLGIKSGAGTDISKNYIRRVAKPGQVDINLDKDAARKLLEEVYLEIGARGKTQVTSSDDSYSEGYESQKQKDKEDKAVAAAARRELLKAKQEFREGLAQIRADQLRQEAELTKAYGNGDMNYEQYMTRRKEIDENYYSKSIQYYRDNLGSIKDINLEDDKDYQTLLEKRAEADKSYTDKIAAYREKIRKRQFDLQVKDIQAQIELARQAGKLADEVELRNRLEKLTKDFYAKERVLTDSPDKIDSLNDSLDSNLMSQRLDLEKIFQQKVSEYRKKYDEQNAANKFLLEKAILEELLKAEKISAEEYASFLVDLKKKYSDDLPGGSKSPEQIMEGKQRELEKKKKQIETALEAGIIDEKEAEKRKKNVDKEPLLSGLSALKDSGISWVSELAGLGSSWHDLWTDMGDSSLTTLEKVGKAASATFAVVNAGLQMATQFAQAAAQKQIAAIEKRYDREKELVQGNSYLAAKLEEDKQRKIAEIKSQAEEKAFRMQVISALGQTIIGAINAYTSTAAIPVVGPGLAPVAAAVAAAAGAANMALLVEQQQASKAQGYASGGYTPKGKINDVAGVVHAGEWVASQKLLADPQAAAIVRMLETAQRSGDFGALSARESFTESVARSNMTASFSPKSAAIIVATGGAAAIQQRYRREQFQSQAAVTAQGGSYNEQTGNVRQSDISVKLGDAIDRLNKRLDEPFVTVNTVTGKHGIKKALDDYDKLIKRGKR